MQAEDDLRGLAKTMEFMRAISILFCVINIYWFCYRSFVDWGASIGVVDSVLMNFDRTTGLFGSVLWTKLFAVVFLALSCLGTKGVKEKKITWPKIGASLAAGAVLFFLPPVAGAGFYIFTMSAGYIGLLMGGVWMSRLLKNDMMDDVFNNENESFQQETQLIENEYSVNLPTRFLYKKRWNDGWINVVNPFRATIVLGTPGSGKSFAVVNSYIRLRPLYSQHLFFKQTECKHLSLGETWKGYSIQNYGQRYNCVLWLSQPFGQGFLLSCDAVSPEGQCTSHLVTWHYS